MREISSDTELRFVLKLPVAQAVAKEVAFLAQTHRGEQPLNPSGHFVIKLGNGAFRRARGEKGQGGCSCVEALVSCLFTAPRAEQEVLTECVKVKATLKRARHRLTIISAA